MPGWAPQVPDIQELLRTKGPKAMLFDNPYAEWYLNSMQLKGSPTWNHQRETYGPDATYDDFREEFDRDSRDADLDALAALIESSGAKYTVLTTKHHEGFTLWPATLPHPKKGRYHAQRDLVADFCTADARPWFARRPVLLGWLRLALQRRRAEQPGRRHACSPERPLIRAVRHGTRSRTHRSFPAVGAVERHLLARG